METAFTYLINAELFIVLLLGLGAVGTFFISGGFFVGPAVIAYLYNSSTSWGYTFRPLAEYLIAADRNPLLLYLAVGAAAIGLVLLLGGLTWLSLMTSFGGAGLLFTISMMAIFIRQFRFAVKDAEAWDTGFYLMLSGHLAVVAVVGLVVLIGSLVENKEKDEDVVEQTNQAQKENADSEESGLATAATVVAGVAAGTTAANAMSGSSGPDVAEASDLSDSVDLGDVSDGFDLSDLF